MMVEKSHTNSLLQSLNSCYLPLATAVYSGGHNSGLKWYLEKVSSTLALLFGVKGKVFGMCSRKILRPDPGLYSQYFPSYAIF